VRVTTKSKDIMQSKNTWYREWASKTLHCRPYTRGSAMNAHVL